MKEFFKKNKFIFILLLIVFILRIPSLFEPYWYGDEGVYLTLGLAIKKGYLLYRDIFDNKTPLIYLLATLANGTMFWFRFILMVSTLTAIYFFHKLANKIQINSLSIKISTILFSILTTIPLIEGNITNAEILILLPTIAGIYLISPHLFSEDKNKINVKNFILFGVIFGIGLLLKVPALFDFFAVIAFLVFFKKEKAFFSIGKKEIALTAGYLIPILITSIFFLAKGVFLTFFNACFLQTMGYLSSWKTGSHSFSLLSLLKSGLVINGIFLLAIILLLWIRRKKMKPNTSFLALWYISALFAATLSGRPYPHYLIQIVPPFCLITGMAIGQKTKQNILLLFSALIILTGSYFKYRFWAYKILSYYKNFTEFALGTKNKDQYFSFFSPKMPEIYKLAEFITSNTKDSDKIFIWADEPYLYPLSRRLPVTPYVVAYHIIERNLYEKISKQIIEEKPSIIIIDSNVKTFTQLDLILSKGYLNINSFSNLAVYKRRLI